MTTTRTGGQAQAHDVGASRVFSSAFDMWVPGLLFCAVLALAAGYLGSEFAALVAIAVFFLGVIPQIKITRANLLIELQAQFDDLAADKDALKFDTAAPRDEVSKRSAYAFYLRFWNLQILEFGLWRYGMLPTDTYSHWIVRRLLSFRSQERYFYTRPLQGWTLVRQEFVGTDFLRFFESAMKIGASIEKAHGGAAIAPTQSSYNELHTRVDRLLVAVGGGLLWSTFIVRSFSARRPSLTQHSAQYWYELTEKPLARERWSSHFAWIAAVSVLLAYGLGYFVRGFGVPVNARGAKITTVGGQNNGVMLLDSSDVALRHIVRFDEEGSCVASPDARIWPGAALSTSNRAHIASIARALAACSTQQNPVRVEVVGFASSSEFRTVANCGKETTSEQANVALANARASNVKASLERNLERNTIALRVWKNDEAMRREREIVDRLDGGTYVGDRGWLNRRVEIRVIDSGACDPNK